MNPDDIPHRAETCPYRDLLNNTSNTVCQILEKLDKLETTLEAHVSSAEEKLERIMNKMEERYVTKESFNPVQKIVYGMVGAVMLSVLGALLALVIQHAK